MKSGKANALVGGANYCAYSFGGANS